MNRKRKTNVETRPSLPSVPVSSPSSAPDIASGNFQSTSAKKLKSVVPHISNDDHDSPDNVDDSVDDSPDNVDNSVDDSPDNVDDSVDDS